MGFDDNRCRPAFFFADGLYIGEDSQAEPGQSGIQLYCNSLYILPCCFYNLLLFRTLQGLQAQDLKYQIFAYLGHIVSRT